MMATATTPAEFGELVFGTVPPDLRIHTFTLATRATSNLLAPNALDIYKGRNDVYVGVGLVDIENRKHRIKNATTKGVAALALDIDIAGTPDGRGGVKKTGAPDLDAAIKLAKHVIEPTVIVHTGNGIHAWYCLHEIARLRDDEQRAKWRHMFYVFADAHHAEAKRSGYEIDHVHDFARVMRIVGTINTKPDEPTTVTVLEQNGSRYTPNQLVDALRRAEAWRDYSHDEPTPIRYIEPDDRDARPLAELLADPANNTIVRLVAHTIGDPDWTLSEYDMSLAARAVRAGWVDDEIRALIKHHRNLNDSDKGDRADYVERTITKARENAPPSAAALIDKLLADAAAAAPPDQPVDILDTLFERVDVARLLETPPPPIDWIVDGYLAAGTLNMLHGDGGLGKSYLTLAISTAIINGAPIIGRATKHSRVGIIDAENSGDELHMRIYNSGLRIGDDLLMYRCTIPVLASDHMLAVFQAFAVKGARLIILDSLRALWDGDEREQAEAGRMLRNLARHAETAGVCVLVIHHDTKGGEYSGSTDINAAISGSRLHLERPVKRGDKDYATRYQERRLTHGKARRGAELAPFSFTLEILPRAIVILPLGDDEAEDDGWAKTITDYVDQHGGEAWVDEMVDKLGISRKTFDRRRGEIDRDAYWIGNESRGKGKVKATVIRRSDARTYAPTRHARTSVVSERDPSIHAGLRSDTDTLGHDECPSAESLYSSQIHARTRSDSLRESAPHLNGARALPAGVDPITGELRRCATCDLVITDNGYHGSWCSSACFHRASTELDDA